jgi:rRNA maturation RNase YbeY
MAVHFFFNDITIGLTNRTELKDFIASIFKTEGKRLQNLNYVFCTDEYLLDINRSSLNHDYYTDIITFDLSSIKRVIEGEIYISVDRVRDNAKSLSVTIQEELHRVIFHGALHLCGYKDKSPKDSKAMRAAEDKYLAKYFK